MEVFAASALQDVVVLEIPAGGGQVAVVLRMSVPIAVAIHVMLELRSGERFVAERLRGLELSSQHRTRRDRDELIGLLIAQIAQHERAIAQPARDAQGPEIGDEMEVTVAELPARKAVARDR